MPYGTAFFFLIFFAKKRKAAVSCLKQAGKITIIITAVKTEGGIKIYY